MRIFVIDPVEASREVLVTRLTEVCRQAQLKRIEVLSGDFELARANAGGEPPDAGFLGPGCYATLEDSVSRFRSFFAKAPLAVVLDNEIYAQEAVDLRRFLSARIMPLADLAQMAQFVLDSSGTQVRTTSVSSVQGVVAVAQLKGGVGATSLAASLATCWAEHQRSVALIDLDDVNPQLTAWAKPGLSQYRTARELLEAGQVSSNRIRELAVTPERFEGRLGILGQPEFYHEGFHFKADVLESAPSSSVYVQSLIPALQEIYDVVVIDMGRSWGISAFALLPLCQQVLLVVDEDRTTVDRTLSVLQRFYRESDDPEEFDFSKWRLMVNAYGGDAYPVEEMIEAVRSAELSPEPMPVQTLLYSATGGDWFRTKDERGLVSLYDLAEEEVRSVIADLAYSLVPFAGAAVESAPQPAGFARRLARLAHLFS